MLVEGLLAGVIVLLLIVIFMIYKFRSVDISKDTIENAISNSWMKSGIDEKIGAIKDNVTDIRSTYSSFEQMLRIPTERGAFGELGLETILSDQLPTEMYGIRKRILDGKIPDAHIMSTVGIICIDSKFPLDNYSNMLETKDNDEKSRYKRQFLRDVKGHLDKIASDYVCPERGSADFAFGYIPSEGVYYFLICEGNDLLREYTKKGIQVVSPLTLSHKIELIKAGVHAMKLSKDAQKIKKHLDVLSSNFRDIDELWRVFYHTHFKNSESKAKDLDTAYTNLKEEFKRVSRLTLKEDGDDKE